ncbi:MAG TPA: histidine phosphatase family protein [Candidatus Dormibacteraeota bacterium]|nr:histidine phosphatase family protein [Candidatus Dormibacteraeota bacterium]
MSIELVYETHAITTDNERGIATGWRPGKLSPAGRRGAEELGARRQTDGTEIVYVSDLQRAFETAVIAFAGSSTPIVRDWRLRECNYGRLNGMRRARLEAQRTQHLVEPWPDGESYTDVVFRTAQFLEELAMEDSGRVLVIAHSANHWAIEHLLLGKDLGALVEAGMTWQPGWEYNLPERWEQSPVTRVASDSQGGTGLSEDAFEA